MNTIALTQAYAKLADRLGKETAETLTTFIAETSKENVRNETKEMATKLDIAALRTELKTEIAETKADMIKWMFIFWAGQLAAMFGLLYFFLKNKSV